MDNYTLTRAMDNPVDDKPAGPKDLSHHLSQITRARPLSSIKRFYKYFGIPGIGQLAGGLPAEAYFPYDTLEANVATADRWKPTPNDPVDPPTKVMAAASLNAALPASRLVAVSYTHLTLPTKRIV